MSAATWAEKDSAVHEWVESMEAWSREKPLDPQARKEQIPLRWSRAGVALHAATKAQERVKEMLKATDAQMDLLITLLWEDTTERWEDHWEAARRLA